MRTQGIYSFSIICAAIAGAFALGVVAARAQEPVDPPEADQVPIEFSDSPSIALAPDFDKDFTVSLPPGLSGRIIFSAHIGDYDRILELDIDGRKVRKIVEGPGNNYYPTFSPDGTKFAFVSDRTGKKQVYVANWDGTDQRVLSTGLRGSDNPTWTANGKGVLFSSEKSEDNRGDTSIFVASVGSGVVVPVVEIGGRNLTPRMSPDGAFIAYSTNRNWPGWDVCLWDIKEKKERCPLQGTESYCRPAWSPKGEEIAYAYGAEDIDIGILSTKDGSKNSLTHLELKEYDPVFSPKGDYLAFVSEAGHKDVFNLYVFDREARKSTLILKTQYSIRYPSWSGETTLKLQAEKVREADAEETDAQKQAPMVVESPTASAVPVELPTTSVTPQAPQTTDVTGN